MNWLVAPLRKGERSHRCGRMRALRGCRKAQPFPEPGGNGIGGGRTWRLPRLTKGITGAQFTSAWMVT